MRRFTHMSLGWSFSVVLLFVTLLWFPSSSVAQGSPDHSYKVRLSADFGPHLHRSQGAFHLTVPPFTHYLADVNKEPVNKERSVEPQSSERSVRYAIGATVIGLGCSIASTISDRIPSWATTTCNIVGILGVFTNVFGAGVPSKMLGRIATAFAEPLLNFWLIRNRLTGIGSAVRRDDDEADELSPLLFEEVLGCTEGGRLV